MEAAIRPKAGAGIAVAYLPGAKRDERTHESLIFFSCRRENDARRTVYGKGEAHTFPRGEPADAPLPGCEEGKRNAALDTFLAGGQADEYLRD
jgi:hypothetical protein